MQNKLPPDAGQVLVADFQSVLTNLAISQMAAREADRSEEELLSQLNEMGRSGYLSPGALTGNESDITRGSLDVHVKKVQAQQMAQMSTQQLAEVVAQANKTYAGRKVMVTALDPANPPFDALWYDSTYGYHSSQYKRQRITGVIKQIQLEENTLVIKPTMQRRLFVRDLEQYMVYVIDPGSLVPLVSLEIL